MNYTDEQLLTRLREIGGHTTEGKYLIIGVQNSDDSFNEFDDKFYLFFGDEFVMATTGTTNPGKNALLNYDKAGLSGAAVLKTDEFYVNAFRNGLHKGRMEALRQNVPFKYYRDADKDEKAEQGGELHEGIIYANFHGVDYDPKSKAVKTNINGWSYGCQVSNNMKDYHEINRLTKANPHQIDYALLAEF